MHHKAWGLVSEYIKTNMNFFCRTSNRGREHRASVTVGMAAWHSPGHPRNFAFIFTPVLCFCLNWWLTSISPNLGESSPFFPVACSVGQGSSGYFRPLHSCMGQHDNGGGDAWFQVRLVSHQLEQSACIPQTECSWDSAPLQSGIGHGEDSNLQKYHVRFELVGCHSFWMQCLCWNLFHRVYCWLLIITITKMSGCLITNGHRLQPWEEGWEKGEDRERWGRRREGGRPGEGRGRRPRGGGRHRQGKPRRGRYPGYATQAWET